MNETTPPPTAADQRQYGLPFFNWVRSLGIVRGDNRWLAGVCGALATRTGLDPLIIRGIAIVIALLGGPIFFFYAVAWALLPDTSGRIHAERVARGDWTPAATGIVILTALSFLPLTHGIWWQGAPAAWGMPDWLEITMRIAWNIALVVGFIALAVYVAKRVPAGALGSAGRTDASAQAPAPAASPASEFVPSVNFVSGQDGTTATASAAASASTHAPNAAPFHTPGTAAADSAERAFAPEAGAAQTTGAAPASGSTTATGPSTAWAQLTQSEGWKASVNGWTEHRNLQLGAGFVSIVLGLAVVTGAVAAVWSAGGQWSETTFLVGGAFALAVIGVGAVIAGVRGKQAGALSFFAIMLAAVLAWVSFFPKGTEFVPFGAPTMSYSQSQHTPGFAVIAGAPTIDLSDVEGTAAPEGLIVDVWLGAGDTTLVLPENTEVIVEASSLAGGINYSAVPGATDRGGMFFHDMRTVIEDPRSDTRLTVRVWTLFGQVTIDELPND